MLKKEDKVIVYTALDLQYVIENKYKHFNYVRKGVAISELTNSVKQILKINDSKN